MGSLVRTGQRVPRGQKVCPVCAKVCGRNSVKVPPRRWATRTYCSLDCFALATRIEQSKSYDLEWKQATWREE